MSGKTGVNDVKLSYSVHMKIRSEHRDEVMSGEFGSSGTEPASTRLCRVLGMEPCFHESQNPRSHVNSHDERDQEEWDIARE